MKRLIQWSIYDKIDYNLWENKNSMSSILLTYYTVSLDKGRYFTCPLAETKVCGNYGA